MNQGALKLQDDFLSPAQFQFFYNSIKDKSWSPVHPEGEYASDGWTEVALMHSAEPTELYHSDPRFKELTDQFQCEIGMFVFYAVHPGHKLHPHRDLSGTYEFGKLRFHIPLITDPGCQFQISKKPVYMKPNELWALNTSYLHALENNSDVTRVHIVLEVYVNDWVRSQLPAPDFRYYTHYVFFLGCILWQALKSVISEPKRLPGRIHLAKSLILERSRRLFGRFSA